MPVIMTDAKNFVRKGSPCTKKTVQNADKVRFGRPLPPSKLVKSGHLSSNQHA